MLAVAFSIYALLSLFYIHRLRSRLRSYEHIWEQIEQVADKNQDGTFTINIQHLEETHPPVLEAHASMDNASSPRMLNLEALRQSNNNPRAA